MRLYDSSEVIQPQFSQEQFNAYYQTASVVSLEALSDYFYKLKDIFSTIQSKVTDLNGDKVVADTLSTRYETEHVIQRLKFIDLKDYLIQKPENFKGKYIDYIKDLILASNEVVNNTEATLNNLKLAISSFINEYSEDKINTLYGNVYFKDAEKITAKYSKEIAQYFPKADTSSKAEVGSVLKSLNDIPVIYNSITTLERSINETKLKNISKLANEASELVDLLLEQNKTSSILLRNDTTKKDLVSALYTSAKQVELVSYLYSNAIFFYSSFKKLSDFLVEKSK